MMKNLILFLVLFLSNVAFSQIDNLPDLLIHYSKDKSVILEGTKKLKENPDSNLTIPSNISTDTLIKYYTIEITFIPDSSYFKNIANHLYIDSVSFSELLNKSGVIMIVEKYGYGGAANHKDLTNKYGVAYRAGGCVYSPSDFEKQFTTLMRRLLLIRNGADWEEKYNKEYKKLRRKNSSKTTVK